MFYGEDSATPLHTAHMRRAVCRQKLTFFYNLYSSVKCSGIAEEQLKLGICTVDGIREVRLSEINDQVW